MTIENIQFIQIGIIHSTILEKGSSPIQSSRSDLEATVEVLPQYEEGLLGIEEFSHIYLFYEVICFDPVEVQDEMDGNEGEQYDACAFVEDLKCPWRQLIEKQNRYRLIDKKN